MPDYSLGKIYRIICNETSKQYIGSTCEPTLARRLAKHRNDYNKYLKNKFHYVTSYDILKNNNYSIELIELYPCSCRDELRAREGFHIKNNVCVNKQIAGNTPKEYYKSNKAEIIAKQKQKYEANKEQISITKKQYYEFHKQKILEKNKERFVCECGSIVQHCQKARHLRTDKHKSYLSQLELTTEPINNI